jgi:hypothetical protein
MLREESTMKNTGYNDALSRIGRLVPLGGNIGIKHLKSRRDAKGNTRYFVSFLCSYEGRILSLDRDIALYWGLEYRYGTITGLWVGKEEGSAIVQHIAHELYKDHYAITFYGL